MKLFLHSKASSDEINTDQELVIIGSGPAGLTAAIYAARAQLNPLVIAGIDAGGQLMTTTEVENFPGFPEIVQGPDLVTRMREQATRLGTTFLEDNVIDTNLSQHPFLVLTGQHQIQAKAIIIATGAEPKRLGLDNEQRLSGRGVSYCATCDAPFFKDVNAAVIGAGDVALEEALFLAKYANDVKIIYRGSKEKMRATKALLQRGFDNEKIEFIYNTVVENILGKERLNGIAVRDIATNQSYELHLGGLLVAIGYIPQTHLFQGKLELGNGYIVHKKHTMTSVPGVFAAGDVVDFRYRQAITAAAEGCQAALDAEKWLQDPDNF
ncbi:thioredoxin-disulfide reductase [Candidatus Heimdallarchaeota archaeon B3_Heim]|nr:MAG: thioredoxin-disulfide reductase [Candidatus Heimdallarchaeota archaeon B3_Heim]